MQIGAARRGGPPRAVLDQHLGHEIAEGGRVVGPRDEKSSPRRPPRRGPAGAAGSPES
jgi:hypothetical protein